MKNEIKAGEYVRLANGDIFKIDEDTTNYYNSNKDFITNEIVKHSPNLIDIIEEGDYVNGKKVYSIGTICSTIGMLRTINFTNGTFLTDDMQIVDVVTKEQFESVSYKVKE